MPDQAPNLDIKPGVGGRLVYDKVKRAIVAEGEARKPEWQPIETAPHEQRVLLGWWYNGDWESEVAEASHGWRKGGYSNMSRHGQATHWQPLPSPPDPAVPEYER